MVGIIYAIPRGGQREFIFSDGAALAEHVQANAPGLFAGCPQWDDKYDETMASMRKRSYRLPEDKK